MNGQDTYYIRIYEQDLCSDWIDIGVGRIPNKYIRKDDLIKDLKDNGLTIIQYTYSSFGGCYFFEVKGVYVGEVTYDVLETTPSFIN